jgi:cytochrome c biogenesis protein CcmG/thiol:disulfide interchange protein DsbE
MWRYFVPLGLIVLLAGFLLRGLYLNPTLIESPLVGQPIPEFSLPSLINRDERVESSDLTGRYSLLNVWAEWCAECYREHAFLMELADSGVPIYGYNYDDERDAALEFLETMGNSYVAIAEDSDGMAAIDWGIYGAPETFLIAQDGTILQKYISVMTPEVWATRFAPLIESTR